MKSYLDLVPIFARVHQKQNRMTIICIVLSVFLVTAVFGMADMAIRGQKLQVIQSSGSWHVLVTGVNAETQAMLKARPEVTSAGGYAFLGDRNGFTVAGKPVQLAGLDKETSEDMFPLHITEGRYPEKDTEIALSENAVFSLGAGLGDTLTLERPGTGPVRLNVAGIMEGTSSMMSRGSFVLMFSEDGFRHTVPRDMYDSSLLMKLSRFSNMQKVIADMVKQLQLREDQIQQNGNLLAAMGQSRNSYVLQLYASAAVLSGIIVLAGVLMIASSLNSHVMRRTEFFGMMRCLGATRRQIMHFVRREALQWCNTAMPWGIGAGIAVVWGLSAVLKMANPSQFAELPVFGVSWIGVGAGVVVGLLTVLLAARSPARRASRVSPLAASTGSVHTLRPVRMAARTSLFKVETALGLHHAVASKKSFLMVVGSFALSIVLYLSFSTTVDFMHHAIRPLKPWNPDFSLASVDKTTSLDPAFVKRLEGMAHVKRVYGRMFAYGLPMETADGPKKADLVSYETHQLKWAEESLLAGSIEPLRQPGMEVLAVYRKDSSLQVGELLQLQVDGVSQQVKVAGILSNSPFDSQAGVETVICSEELFRRLTGQTGYTVIDVQFSKGASDETVQDIQTLAGREAAFSDRRTSNSEARGSYFSYALFIYGFLAVIALITIFHIVNTIAMSVRSRIQHYGAMRAIGMSSQQLVRMILAEAAVYAVCGTAVGCALGLPVHRLLYGSMITSYWGEVWQVPYGSFAVISLIVISASFLAVRGPVRQIQNLSIVDTINAQ
ncbi:ABC transporter permease [Paenibacillus mesotrionivorans]|uniref:ABC transporter permease n=1 Tax=Paenibacillus mesotrionivorans TaxID=3160968 RepID=A0ACC7P059_9BACL